MGYSIFRRTSDPTHHWSVAPEEDLSTSAKHGEKNTVPS